MKLQMRLFNGPSDWGWVQQFIPLNRCDDTCGLMAIDEEKNETVGAMIFDNFLHNSCHLHIVLDSSTPIKYGFLEECADMVFEGFGREYVYAYVSGDNYKSLRLCKRMGFTEKTRFKGAYTRGIDYVLLELHRDNCTLFNQTREVA